MPRPNAPELSHGPWPLRLHPWTLIGAAVLTLSLLPVRARDEHLAAAPAADVFETHVYLPQLFTLRPVPSPVPSPPPTKVVAAGRVTEIAQRGDRVYATVGAEIVVSAITDVRRPAIVGRVGGVPPDGTVYDLAVAAGRLVALRMVLDDSYVDTYDLADPDHPRFVGTVETGWVGDDGIATLTGYGDYVLQSFSCSGLNMLDARVTGPARVVARSGPKAWGYLEAVIGQVAVLHTGHCSRWDPPSALVTVDLRDPLHPRMAGELPRPEWPHNEITQMIGARNTPFGAMFLHDVGLSAVLLAASEDGTLRQTDTVLAGGFRRAVTDSTGHLYVTYESSGQSRTKAVALGSGTTPEWTIVGSLATPPRIVATASLGLVVTLDTMGSTLTAIDYRDVANPVLGADLVIPAIP